jgi:hypothetical protein
MFLLVLPKKKAFPNELKILHLDLKVWYAIERFRVK